MKLPTIRLIALACLLASSSSTFADDALSPKEFRRLHRELRPSRDEAWRSIPWKISLLDAQQVAAKAQKPLFIWAMDGHPLGCT